MAKHDVCTGLEVILLLMESSLLRSFGTERAKHGHCSAVVNLRSKVNRCTVR